MPFFLVKYGKNKHHIFNIECQVKILLESMKTKCELDKSFTIDLADQEGSVLNLTKNELEYASLSLTPRKLFLLVKVEAIGSECKYEPLFDIVTEKDRELSEKIREQSTYNDDAPSPIKSDRKLSGWKSAGRAIRAVSPVVKRRSKEEEKRRSKHK